MQSRSDQQLRESSPIPTFPSDSITPQRHGTEDDDGESIICIQSGHRNYASIAAQMDTLRSAAPHAAGTSTAESTNGGSIESCHGSTISDTHIHTFRKFVNRILPPTSRLYFLLNLFFEEFNYFYPCVDQDEFNMSVRKLLDQTSESTNSLPSTEESHQMERFTALLLMVLAIAEFYEISARPNDPSPRGEGRYRESMRLLDKCSWQSSISIEIVGVRILECLYMLMRQHFRKSSQALCQTVELAYALGLNDESSWNCSTAAQCRSYRTLWWTIYLHDRRLAHKLGRPYLIRDSEVSVADFAPDIAALENGMERERSQMKDPTGHLQRSCLSEKLDFGADWYHYLQFHVKWSRLFAKAWDTFYSLKRSDPCDMDEVEVVEALLEKTKASLPSHLRWDTNCNMQSIRACSSDHKMRLKLVIQTVRCSFLIVRFVPLKISRMKHANPLLLGSEQPLCTC